MTPIGRGSIIAAFSSSSMYPSSRIKYVGNNCILRVIKVHVHNDRSGRKLYTVSRRCDPQFFCLFVRTEIVKGWWTTRLPRFHHAIVSCNNSVDTPWSNEPRRCGWINYNKRAQKRSGHYGKNKYKWMGAAPRHCWGSADNDGFNCCCTEETFRINFCARLWAAIVTVMARSMKISLNWPLCGQFKISPPVAIFYCAPIFADQTIHTEYL